MELNPDVVPATIDEAIELLESSLEPTEWATLRTSSPAEFHFSAGSQLRNYWSLWEEGTPLRHSFKELGLTHPDDLSAFLMEHLCCKARGETFDRAAFIAKTHDHWNKTLGRPIP